MTTTNSDSNMGEKRYDLLLKLIDTGIAKSRKSLNVAELVKETYGEDASVYGGSDMLEGILESMLDKIDQQAKSSTVDYLKKNLVEEQLGRIEGIIERLQKEEMIQQKKEEADHSSAQQALDLTFLPPDLTLSEIMMYTAYQRQLKQKQAMEEALKNVEEEIIDLERIHDEAQHTVQGHTEKLRHVAKTLEESANVCSMVTTS